MSPYRSIRTSNLTAKRNFQGDTFFPKKVFQNFTRSALEAWVFKFPPKLKPRFIIQLLFRLHQQKYIKNKSPTYKMLLIILTKNRKILCHVT